MIFKKKWKMSYPKSPFAENFNYDLINNLAVQQSGDKTILNEDLRKTLKWLCSSPKITSIRVNILMNTVHEILEVINNHFNKYITYSPKVYVHAHLSNVIIIESEDVSKKKNLKYEKEVIVDTECASSVLRGAHIYAPGVLGMMSGCQVDDNVSIYADISKKCKKGLQKLYSDDQKVFLGNGKVKMQRYQLFGETIPSGIAVEITETISGCFPISDSVLPLGSGLLQNLPSILCVQALFPQPGDVVIDLCASPGNKTTHLAELMQNKGTLIAIDKTPNKVDQLRSRCENFGVKVQVFQADSTKIVLNDSSTSKCITDGPPFSADIFDKVLLDAPCSVLGKRPQLVNKMKDNEIKSYVPLQRKLFESAVKLLKRGGTMVYSTCTITLAENEGIVAWALRNFTNLELIKPPLELGSPGWEGTTLTEAEIKLLQRFGPNDHVDSVGFFFACFRKI